MQLLTYFMNLKLSGSYGIKEPHLTTRISSVGLQLSNLPLSDTKKKQSQQSNNRTGSYCRSERMMAALSLHRQSQKLLLQTATFNLPDESSTRWYLVVVSSQAQPYTKSNTLVTSHFRLPIDSNFDFVPDVLSFSSGAAVGDNSSEQLSVSLFK